MGPWLGSYTCLLASFELERFCQVRLNFCAKDPRWRQRLVLNVLCTAFARKTGDACKTCSHCRIGIGRFIYHTKIQVSWPWILLLFGRSFEGKIKWGFLSSINHKSNFDIADGSEETTRQISWGQSLPEYVLLHSFHCINVDCGWFHTNLISLWLHGALFVHFPERRPWQGRPLGNNGHFASES